MRRELTRQPPFAVLLALAWLLVLIQLMAEYWPMTATAMHDADDALRLVQVRDFLTGHGWFNLHEARLGLSGYDSHWSRLIDAGLAGLFRAFNAFVNDTLAERLMMALWPVLWLVPTMGAAVAIAWRVTGRDALFIVLLLAVFGLPGMGQFRPGRIDHHNVQIALAVLTVAATVWSDRVRWAGWAAGALTGLALAIGFEGLPILVLCGAALALHHVIDDNAAPALRRYALALAAGTLAAFLVSVAPEHWAGVACDAIAINTVAAVVAAGLGLVAASMVRSAVHSIRCVATGLAAVAAATVFAAWEPRCLGGPYAMMDPALRSIWLAHMAEMQSIAELMREGPIAGVATAAFPILALLAVLFAAQRPDLRRDFGFVVAGAAFVLAFVIMLAVTKIYGYAMWLGVPLVAVALLHLFRSFALESLVVRFLVALLVTPTAFTFGAMRIASAAGLERNLDVASPTRQECLRRDSYAALALLPPGLVVANELEWGPFVLAWTPHPVLAAPYHRLSASILTAHRIFARPPAEAHAILDRVGAAYVVICGTVAAADLTPEEEAASFAGRMQAGDIPDWLEPVPQTEPEAIAIYRVKR